MTWRNFISLHATPGSVAAGRISVLACAETLLAIYLAFWPLREYLLYAWIPLFLLLAPVFQLRSPLAVRLSLREYNRGLMSRVNQLSPAWHWRKKHVLMRGFSLYTRFVALFFYVPLAAAWIRIKTFCWVLYRRPSQTLYEIPENWKRSALIIDFTYPPEIVPGLETAPSYVDSTYRFGEHFKKGVHLVEEVYGEKSPVFKLIYIAGFILHNLLLVVPVYFSRVYWKLATIIYFSLFFFSNPNASDLRERLWIVTKRPLAAATFVFAIVQAAINILPFVLLYFAFLVYKDMHDVLTKYDNVLIGNVFGIFVFPLATAVKQQFSFSIPEFILLIARAFNVISSIVFYNWASHQLYRMEQGVEVNQQTTEAVVTIVTRLRNVCTAYTILIAIIYVLNEWDAITGFFQMITAS